MTWKTRVRARQAWRRLQMLVTLLLLAGLMATLVLSFPIGWALVFGEPPRRIGALFEALMIGAGTTLGAIVTRLRLDLPFRGKAPEEAAAEAFFAKEDVRSDDHAFERDLTP